MRSLPRPLGKAQGQSSELRRSRLLVYVPRLRDFAQAPGLILSLMEDGLRNTSECQRLGDIR